MLDRERDGLESSGDRRVNDRELVARLVAGDQAALGEVYDRYSGLVYGLARRVLADTGLAEDVTQEVFALLWEHPERFDPTRGTLRAWLGAVTHHRSVDRVRHEIRRSKTEARTGTVEPVAGAQSEVDDELSLEWLATRVRAAIEHLPDEQRDVVVLAYYGGRTYRQVAAELAIPEGTAKSRVRLALAKLDDLLRPALNGQEAPAWT